MLDAEGSEIGSSAKMLIFQESKLWIGHLATSYGHMELLSGEGAEPNLKVLLLVERFLEASADYLAAVRRSTFKIPILWRPIRLAVNDEGRLGVQFKHRLTGKQAGMFFADEHSDFSLTVPHVSIEEADERRLVQRIAMQDQAAHEVEDGPEPPEGPIQ